MPRSRSTSNRGPAAAAENRRAILTTARTLFTERGYHVPLSAIAQAAGVGQGVLYRHFPTRLDLAFAVFDEHWGELEAIAAEPDTGAFGRLWSRLVDLTLEEAAFIEMIVDARRNHPDYDGPDRLRAILAEPLDRAARAGLVDPALTVEDVMLGQRMVHGVVVTSLEPDTARQAVRQALAAAGRLPRLGPDVDLARSRTAAPLHTAT